MRCCWMLHTVPPTIWQMPELLVPLTNFCLCSILLVSICLVVLGHVPEGLLSILRFLLPYDPISISWDYRTCYLVTALQWPCTTSCIDWRSSGLRRLFVPVNLVTSKTLDLRCFGKLLVCVDCSSSVLVSLFWICANMGCNLKRLRNSWYGVMLGTVLRSTDAPVSTVSAAELLGNISCSLVCRMVFGAHQLLRSIPSSLVVQLHPNCTKSLPHPVPPRLS